jgi:hypothetical protein
MRRRLAVSENRVKPPPSEEAGTRPLRVFHLIKGLGRGGAEILLADGPRLSDRRRFEYAFGYFVPHKRAVAAEIEATFGRWNASTRVIRGPWCCASGGS